jgi:cytochrome c-type biogenesis protein CcmH/NrfG
MAVCPVCGGIYDNLDGVCPSCGAEASDESAHELFNEAMKRIHAGQVIDARGLLSQAIRKDATKWEYHFYLGSVHYKIGEFGIAYNTWQKADRMNPGNDRIEKCLVAARQRIAEKEKK